MQINKRCTPSPPVLPSYHHHQESRPTCWRHTRTPSVAYITTVKTSALNESFTSFKLTFSSPISSLQRWSLVASGEPARQRQGSRRDFLPPAEATQPACAVESGHLADIFKMLVMFNTIPTWWNLVSIVPLLKLGKPSTLAAPNRFISL